MAAQGRVAAAPPPPPQMYSHIKEEMARGHCIYIVCPFVETSDKMVGLGARRLGAVATPAFVRGP